MVPGLTAYREDGEGQRQAGGECIGWESGG